MTIQQKHDAFLLYCVRASESINASLGARIILTSDEAQELIAECDLGGMSDVVALMRSLSDDGLLQNDMSGGRVIFRITMDGLRRAELLGGGTTLV